LVFSSLSWLKPSAPLISRSKGTASPLPATITETSVVIQWKAAGFNGRVILSYVIETYNFWEGFWRIVRTNVYDNPVDSYGTYQLNVTGLRPFSEYQVRIRAENELGTSDPSDASERFTTLPVKPDLAPLQVGGGGGKAGTLVTTWQPLNVWEENALGFGYRTCQRVPGDIEWEECVDVPGNQAQYVWTIGEEYYYLEYEMYVQAYNDKGVGPRSETVTIKSAMGIPTVEASNVRSMPFNSTACRLTWIEITDDRETLKGKLGGYRLAYWPTELGMDYENPPRVTINGQTSEGLVIGLDPDTQYYFALYIWNEAGNGPKSQPYPQRTLRNGESSQCINEPFL
jgi:hypothetical protein